MSQIEKLVVLRDDAQRALEVEVAVSFPTGALVEYEDMRGTRSGKIVLVEGETLVLTSGAEARVRRSFHKVKLL